MASSEQDIASTTEAFDYILRRSVQNYDHLTSDEPCILVDTFLADVDYLGIPCFICSGFSSLDAYIRHYRQEITNMVLSKYSSLPWSFVDEMAREFALFLEEADADYVCPHEGRPESGPSYMLQIFVDPLAVEDMVARESFEEAAPVMKPATRESVEGLLALRSQQQQHIQQFQCKECVICIDRIETSGTALTMPCSHEFHEDCLVQWLKNSHVCPLCRYEMPAADLH